MLQNAKSTVYYAAGETANSLLNILPIVVVMSVEARQTKVQSKGGAAPTGVIFPLQLSQLGIIDTKYIRPLFVIVVVIAI